LCVDEELALLVGFYGGLNWGKKVPKDKSRPRVENFMGVEELVLACGLM
jgi:hypothetical protein